MSIADAVEAIETAEHPPTPVQCKLCFYLPRMEQRDRDAIERGLRGALSAGKIALIMTNHGRPLSKAAVQRHQAHMTQRTEPTTA